MRRFESCWGRTVTSCENDLLNSRDAVGGWMPCHARMRRDTSGSDGLRSLYAPENAQRSLAPKALWSLSTALVASAWDQ